MPDDIASKVVYKSIPEDLGLPIIGHTFEVLRDTGGYGTRMRETHGDIYKSRNFGMEVVQMLGADANEFVLMDRGQNFSSKFGWAGFLERLFPNGLMLMDFDHHRGQRRIMATAFKTDPMRGYHDMMQEVIPSYIEDWGKQGRFPFYQAIKQTSLELATRVFLGLEVDENSAKISTALTDMVQAATGVVRVPLPFTKMGRGVAGRRFMQKFIRDLIPERRQSHNRTDLFTHLCRATDDDGKAFTEDEIIDHLNFLWMAAHDTITSSVTTLVYELGRNPEWQAKLRDEITALGAPDKPLAYEDLGKMPLVECAFKEALRINPPVPSTPRKAVRDVTFGDYLIPKDTLVGISAFATHRDERYWPNPKSFDPMRFSPEGGVKERHKFAWIPFGGGAHMCLGLHFAYMQAKLIMYHLLPHYDIKLDEGYETSFQIVPLIKPKDDLPLELIKREA